MELTGTTKQEERQDVWNRAHIKMVFMTPQTFKNDVFVGEWAAAKAAHWLLPTLFRVPGRVQRK